MGSLFGLYPFLLKLYADSGYQGAKFQDGLRATCSQINLEIVKRSDRPGFFKPTLSPPRRVRDPLPPITPVRWGA